LPTPFTSSSGLRAQVDEQRAELERLRGEKVLPAMSTVPSTDDAQVIEGEIIPIGLLPAALSGDEPQGTPQ
jgi:hypothetical protein